MKKYFFLSAIAAAMSLLTSCSPFTLVNSETYNNADLADYKTFRIVTPDQGKLPDGMQMVTYYNIAAAIREQMLMRGYTESATSPLLINIGLTVHREIATEPVIPNPAPVPVPPPAPVVRPFPVPPPGHGGPQAPGAVPPPPRPVPGPMAGPVPGPYYNGLYPSFIYPRDSYMNSYYAGARVITGIYKEGVLTMDMVNIQTKVPLFSSSVATILENGNSQFRNLQGIAEAVAKLFEKFPVPVEPQYLKKN